MSLDRTLSVAPMMGCTDRHCRRLLRLLAPHALLYTEMVTTGALLHGDAPRFLAHSDDTPCALQLGGSDPAALARCAQLGEDAGYQEINLNVGCPSDRVQQGGIGACLMAKPELVARCVEAMQHVVSIPVTVKSRIGIDDDDSYAFFHRFVATLAAGGCRTFIVHARKAILTGLSPKQNREIPPLRYDYVRRIRDEFTACTFILNGGIRTAASALELLGEFSGVMLGRAPYSDPWLLAELEERRYGVDMPNRLDVLSDYRDHIDAELARGESFRNMGRHLLGFFTGQPGARAFRRALSENMFRAGAGTEVIDQALAASGHSQPTAIARTGTSP